MGGERKREREGKRERMREREKERERERETERKAFNIFLKHYFPSIIIKCFEG